MCNGSTDAYSSLAGGFGLRAGAPSSETVRTNEPQEEQEEQIKKEAQARADHFYFERLGHNNIMNRSALWEKVFDLGEERVVDQ